MFKSYGSRFEYAIDKRFKTFVKTTHWSLVQIKLFSTKIHFIKLQSIRTLYLPYRPFKIPTNKVLKSYSKPSWQDSGPIKLGVNWQSSCTSDFPVSSYAKLCQIIAEVLNVQPQRFTCLIGTIKRTFLRHINAIDYKWFLARLYSKFQRITTQYWLCGSV